MRTIEERLDALEENYKEVLKALEFVSTRKQEVRLKELTKRVMCLHSEQWDIVNDLARMRDFFNHMQAFFPDSAD